MNGFKTRYKYTFNEFLNKKKVINPYGLFTPKPSQLAPEWTQLVEAFKTRA